MNKMIKVDVLFSTCRIVVVVRTWIEKDTWRNKEKANVLQYLVLNCFQSSSRPNQDR